MDFGVTNTTTPTIENLPPESLKRWAMNARTHSKKQIEQLAPSIQAFGFTNPILIDEHGTIMAGHGWVAAAIEIGLATIPSLRIEHLSEDEKRAYVIADNKLALNAGWDEELLAIELGALASIDSDIDIDLTGFSIAEVDIVIESVEPKEPNDPQDDLLPDEEFLTEVMLGDIWQLGHHRLICGNALDPDVVSALMDGETAAMVFTDPPYNVKIDGNVGGG
jgi:hypothetical protein